MASDKARIAFMEASIAAGGDRSEALNEQVRRLEAARELERQVEMPNYALKGVCDAFRAQQL